MFTLANVVMYFRLCFKIQITYNFIYREIELLNSTAQQPTDTAERSISTGRESLQVCLGNRRRGVLAVFTTRVAEK
jgi:hypothetical protein